MKITRTEKIPDHGSRLDLGCKKQPHGTFSAVSSEISDADFRTMIKMAAHGGDALTGSHLIKCKHNVFDDISRLVVACSWIWWMGQIDLTNQESFNIVIALDCGMLDSSEREDILAANTSSELQATFRSFICDGLETRMGFTQLRSEMIDDKTWYASTCGERWRGLGIDHFILSFFPLEQNSFSAICFHRRNDQPNFSPREQTIVDVMFHGINWLHQVDQYDAASNDLACLTRREREVLALVLKGSARKSVASALMISQHTVADHLKEIYRKLEVNSRPELLAKFIPGTRISSPITTPDELF